MPDNSAIPEGFELEAPAAPAAPLPEPEPDQNRARYVPIALRAADSFGVPRALFLWQIGQESNWNPNARNPAPGTHASGIAQFQPGTAKQFGLDPLNPEDSLYAAARYMRELHDKTGDWTSALKHYGTVGDDSPDTVKRAAAQVTPEVPAGFQVESAIPEGFEVEKPAAQQPASAQPASAQYGIKPAQATFADHVRQFVFGGPEGETALGRAFPSLAGGKISDTAPADLPVVRFEQPLAPGANPAVYVAHGVNQFATGLTTPKNLAIMAATGGLGAIIPAAGYPSVAGKIINTALSAYFADQMVKGASDAMQAAYSAHQQGNDNEAARLLGYGSVAGLMAGAAGFHAASSGEGVLSTKVPRPAARPLTPEVVPPEAKPEPEPIAAAPPPTVDVQAEPPAEATPPDGVPAGVPPAKPAEAPPIPTGFEVESQPGAGQVSTSAEAPNHDNLSSFPDWFKAGQANPAEPIRKEGDQTTVSVVRWQRTPDVPEVNPQGATFFSVANQAGQDSHSTYAGKEPTAIHWGGEHQVTGDISFSNPLELPTEKQGKYNLPLPEQIIQKLAGPAAADFDRHYSMEAQLQKFGIGRGRGFLDREAELEAKLGIPPGTIADARSGPPGQIANSVAIALLRRDGYDGAIGRPQHDQDLAEAVRLTPLAPQAQDDALPEAAHQAPAVEEEAPATPTGSPDLASAPGPAEEETPAKEVGVSTKVPALAPDTSRERPVAYGHPVEVAVPGEPKRYQAKYALREASDVEPSHNPQSFEANPNYEHRNDRDYSRAINGARPVEYSSPGTFDTGYVVKESHTAEHGHTVTDNRRNALGGNARLLTQLRVYARGGADADKLKAETIRAATTYGGISPDEAAKFEHPLLTREVEGDLSRSEAQNAITDFNKAGAASLTPAEQSLSDSRRVSPDTLDYLSFQIAEQGEDGTLAQVLSGSKGPAIIERLIADGVISANQRGKYITEKGVTAEGKQRITQLMVGRLFDSPAEFDATAPELRNKLEKIVGPLARVEVNPEWSLTEQTREAVGILNDARQHGIKNLDDLERQDTIFDKDLSDDPLAIARLIHAGQVKAAAAFRQYAADFEVFQKAQEGHAFDFLTPPTPREAFESAFLKEPEAGEKPEPLASLTEGQIARLDDFRKQGWFSQMVRTIEQKMPARVSPEQALAILKNPQHGVKADELKWTDMEDWLAKQSGPLTQQEILDHAISGLVSVREINPGSGKYQQYTLAGVKKDYGEMLFTIQQARDLRWQARREAIDKLNRKYGHQSYGPHNSHWMHAGQAVNRGADPLTPEERAEWDRVDDAWARSTDEHDEQTIYRSPHWDQKNVVAHARFDERHDLEGKRVLFLEEIQSDWHQAGREKGYKSGIPAESYAEFGRARGMTEEEIQTTFHSRDPRFREWSQQAEAAMGELQKVPQAPFAKTWHEMVFRRLVRHAAERGFDSVAWTTGKQQADRYNLAKHVAGVAWEPIRDSEMLEAARASRDGWGELAAEFQTEAQYQPGYLLTKSLKNQRDGITNPMDAYDRVDGKPLRAGDLPDYIGKEAAKRLLSTELKDGRHTLEGEEMQVGGHGMNGFYDSILPAYAAKFGKKWGERPTLTRLDTREKRTHFHHYEGPEYSLEQVKAALALALHIGNEVRRSPFTSQVIDEPLSHYESELRIVRDHLQAGTPFNEAVDQAGPRTLAPLLGGTASGKEMFGPAKTEQVHSLGITPAMRKSVMQGQPLFVRNVPLDPAKPHTFEEVARQIDWRITPATSKRPAILRVNHPAALAISEAGQMDQFDGVTLSDESLDGTASLMKSNAQMWRVRGFITPESQARIDALAKGLEELQGQGWRAAVVNRSDLAPGAPFASIRKNARTESEELTHVQQVHYTAGYDSAKHLTPAMRRLVLDHPAWDQGLFTALDKQGYGEKKSLHVNILEAGAKLAAGYPMGLTPEQRDSYLERYFQALKQTHGPVPASEVFRFASRPIRTTLGVENAPREAPPTVHRARSTRKQDPNYGLTGEDDDARTGGSGANRPRATQESLRPLAEGRPAGDTGSLFGDDENQEVADTAARDRDQLQGQRLTAQLNAPLTRDEQLKKLKRTKEDPAAGEQSDFFEAPPEKPQGSLFSKSKDEGVTLGAGLGALDPYLRRFLKGDVVPTLKQLAELARLYKGDLLKLLAPAAVEGAEPMALSVRHRAAELARATDVAHATLKAAGKYFDTRPEQENFDFIDRVETGAKQPTPELQAIHDILRPMLDGRRDAIRALGTGKLQKAIENYFPHLYKDPKQAQAVFENAGKRPLEGSKSFLKKRTIATFKDAIAQGLEPFSSNPVDLVLAKVREMDKYLAAHRIFADAKERGQLVAIDARDGQAPNGWKKIDDPMATIYGPSIQQINEYPNEGLHTGLDTVANALGLKQERGFLNLHGAVGRANQRTGTVKTLHGTAEDVLAHEIGHQIDWLAGSGKRFVEQYPDAQSAARLKRAYKTLKPGSGSTLADRQAARKELKDLAPQIQQRKAFAKELRDLADLRGGRKEYIRKREEKMAQLAQMWVGAREQFERTAPTVFKEWKRFLDENPKLHALRDIEGSVELKGLSQPYDVGGLVIKAHWWAPDAAARILNNYLSPGLRDKSAIVRSFLSVSNFMNQAQLGFSGFHAAFTLTEAATSHLALAIYQGVNGILDGDARSVAQSFRTAAFSPLAPFTSLMRGHQMLQEWNRPGSQSALIGQLADAAVIAGGRAKQESFYQTHITERMMKAWREGNIFGAAWRAPFAAFEVPTRLIMEGLVPRLKMGAFADMAEHELARLGPNAAVMDVERALAKVWDSVDNRFGQLVYDDLFWHKYTKDLAMMLVRSPGWNVGDIRELGGGYADSAKFLKNSGEDVRMVLKGGTWKAGRRGRFTHRMAYIPAHLIVAMTLAGLATYIYHKRAPRDLKEWFFFTDSHGQRWSLPTYVKDEFHYYTDPIGTAIAKLNPILPLAKAILTNKDYWDRKIVHAHHWPAELKQFAEYVLEQYEPLWMQQNHHALDRQTTADKILPELGITHAPKALDKHGSSSGSVHLHR